MAWSVARLGRRHLALGAASLAACLGIMVAFLPGYYAGRYLRDEMQTMARILGAYARPDDIVLLIAARSGIERHRDGAGSHDGVER